MSADQLLPTFFDIAPSELRGRILDDRDLTATPPVIVVNETFARRFFGDSDPIGARVKQGWPQDNAPWRQIVGVVNDVHVSRLQGDPTLQVYMPVRQVSQSGVRSWCAPTTTWPHWADRLKRPCTKSIRTCRCSTCRP